LQFTVASLWRTGVAYVRPRKFLHLIFPELRRLQSPSLKLFTGTALILTIVHWPFYNWSCDSLMWKWN